MNAEILKKSGIDYDRGVRRFAGRAQLYEKALAKFPRDTTFARIRAAYDAGDEAQLLASAHEFKGMCGNIALTALYETSDAIVQLLRRGGDNGGALAEAWARLEREYRIVYEAVNQAMEVSV